jgi:hypothetical protein
MIIADFLSSPELRAEHWCAGRQTTGTGVSALARFVCRQKQIRLYNTLFGICSPPEAAGALYFITE